MFRENAQIFAFSDKRENSAGGLKGSGDRYIAVIMKFEWSVVTRGAMEESLRRERAQLLNPLTPWYHNRRESVAATVPFGAMTRVVAVPPLRSAIAKHTEVFAKPKAKRPKDYSSDSSASAKSAEGGKTEGRIYRAPKGSGKDYFVYWKGKKISVGRLIDEEPQQQRRREGQLQRASQLRGEKGQVQGRVLGV